MIKMNETIIHIPKPFNEPVFEYAPRSSERNSFIQALKALK